MILALREAAALGPFFTLALSGEATAEIDWHPFTQLGAPVGVAVLADQISRLGEFLATDEERAVASILHLGAASALCAPLLATAALAGTIPALEPGQLRFGFQGNGPLRLALDSLPPDAPRALLPALADALIGVVLDGLLASFTIALTKAVAVPENTLQGNVFRLSRLLRGSSLRRRRALGRGRSPTWFHADTFRFTTLARWTGARWIRRTRSRTSGGATAACSTGCPAAESAAIAS